MNNKTSLETLWRAALTVVCLLAATIVTYSRIYLQYHTWNQVLTGSFVGFLLGSAWFALTYIVLTPLYPMIASWLVFNTIYIPKNSSKIRKFLFLGKYLNFYC